MLAGKILKYVFSLGDEEGGFMASSTGNFFGVADGKVSDIAASVYAVEIANILGAEVPYPEKTAAYLQARQRPEGYFKPLEPRPGIAYRDNLLYNTCMGIRGLKTLGFFPKYDPRKWLDSHILNTGKIPSYYPDFYANSYAALEENMDAECENKLSDFLLQAQNRQTGWLEQPGLRERGLPLCRNNPFNFHAARFFHLAGKRIPMGNKILEKFLEFQEDDFSWKQGGVHGTFDACVAIRILSDNSEKYRNVIEKAGEWALTCMQEDGGFNHFGKTAITGYPDNSPSEMDAGYFHTATLSMAGILPYMTPGNNKWIGWGHSLLAQDISGA